MFKDQEGKCPVCAFPMWHTTHDIITRYSGGCTYCEYAFQIYARSHWVMITSDNHHEWHMPYPRTLSQMRSSDVEAYNEDLDAATMQELIAEQALLRAKRDYEGRMEVMGSLYKAFVVALYNDPYCMATRMAFCDWLSEHGHDAEAAAHLAWSAEKQQAIKWMQEFAASHTVPYSHLMLAANEWTSSGQNIFYYQQGRETLQELDPATEEAFWHNWQLITGVTSNAANGNPFACSC